MKYAYEDLADEQFEDLVVFLCQKLLGISVQGFAKGPDGGRDAKFIGTAELHPSKAAPWVGTTIIQAKHTNGFNKHFSEPDFFSRKNGDAVISKEIPRIKKLRGKKQLDHYMLFANRRMSGNAESEIQAYLSRECGMPLTSIYLCGVEQLERWLKSFPTVAELARLDLVDSPLIVSPEELAEVVEAFAAQKDGVNSVLDDPPTPRILYAEKNVINNMSDAYAQALQKRYLKETAQIRNFLADPGNLELLRLYETVVDEFQLKILSRRKDYQSFDAVMEYLLDLLFNRDAVLRANKRLTRALLFYMYWNCDIGAESDAAAN